MESSLSSATRERLAQLRQFVDRELVPLEPLFLTADWSKLEPVLAEKRRAAKAQELWAPNLPKEIGGLGFSLVEERVLDRAIQVHGALGMTDDTILAFLYRHERAARIYDGPDEVHKLSVAKSLLKQHASRS